MHDFRATIRFRNFIAFLIPGSEKETIQFSIHAWTNFWARSVFARQEAAT